MKKFKSLVLAGIAMVVSTTQVMALTTADQNVTVSANVQDAITLWVENSGSTGLVTALSFGNVDGVGKNPASGSADAVRIQNTSSALTDPLTAFGSGYTAGAYYIVNSSTSAPALNLRVRITGGYDANVYVKQSAATMSIWTAASNNPWTSTTGLTSVDATGINLAGTTAGLSGTALTTARTNDTVVPLDLAIKVLPLDTVAAQNSTLVFTANSNGF